MTLSAEVIHVFLFAFGAVIGSFLNVCIHRLPESGSIVAPPSACPGCSAPIRFYDNIPIISYIFLMGRCRACKAPISVRYPLVEALTAAMAVFLYARYALTLEFLVYFVFTSALIVVTFIDLKHRIIPDVISLPGILVAFVAAVALSFKLDGYAGILPGVLHSVIGLLVGGGILFTVSFVYHVKTGREGMGGGDIKLLAMVGALLGLEGVIFTLFTGSFVGAVVGGGLMLFLGKDRKYAVPFGPFLALGALVYIFSGESIIHWYLISMSPG